ncbi:MAG: arsenite methyltransferase [Gemmatimonadaceae bacterium]
MTAQQNCCGPECCSDQDAVALSAAPLLAAAPQVGGEALRAVVRETYGAAARRASAGETASCGCGTSCCSTDGATGDPITSNLYDALQVAGLPATALLASLGCGNPTALAELHEGERVLDLGSGGGIDVLLSARRVGSTGKAYGLDMTSEMLRLARENQQRSGLTNVEFLKGEIEHIPLPDETVDVVISNCVINLSADKPQVLREAFRVLTPGGRLAVSDVVLRGDLPKAVRDSVPLFTGCVSGALTDGEYAALLAGAGFEEVEVEPTRVYGREESAAMLQSAGLESADLLDQVTDRVMSAFVRARKPTVVST